MIKRLDQLEEWEQRLVAEHWELEERLKKLQHALLQVSHLFPPAELKRLQEQEVAMRVYHDVVEKRLVANNLL